MAATACQIRECLSTVAVTPAGSLPVVFCGLPVRCIGFAVDGAHHQVDALMISQRLSATYISRAEIDGRRVYLCHG